MEFEEAELFILMRGLPEPHSHLSAVQMACTAIDRADVGAPLWPIAVMEHHANEVQWTLRNMTLALKAEHGEKHVALAMKEWMVLKNSSIVLERGFAAPKLGVAC